MADEFEYGFGFQAGSRKLLAEKEDRLTPTAPAPGSSCRDMKTGEVVSCRSPHTLVMILAGMSCMMFLVTVALILLFCSVVKQHRQRREQVEQPADSTLPQTAIGHTVPVDSPEYDDAVLVQLPGYEKPQFFALPKPFLVDGEKDVEKKVVDIAIDGHGGEKDASEPPEAPPGADRQQPDDRPSV